MFRAPAGFAPSAAGYRSTPWPAGRAHVEQHFALGTKFDGASAVRCETAGNDLLDARATVPCDSVPQPLDLVLCVIDAKTGLVHGVARTVY